MATIEDEAIPVQVSRRSVLKWMSIGTGSALAAAGAGIGVRGAVNGAFTAGSGASYGLWHDWAALTGVDRVVAAGVLACNPHNTQPWRIGRGADVIEIHSDPARRMPVNDAADREHFAGLGCAVENTVVAAGSAGFAAAVTLFPDGPAADVVARIGLTPLDGRPDPDGDLARAIPLRHTNRGPYTAGPVDTALIEASASRIDGAGLTWVTDRAAMGRLGALYVEATRAIVADRAQSEEAFSWFRNDRADIDRHRDGLTLDCQGLDRV
ncbi:MAG: hypothetical protein QOK35_1755, partial [Pseudonocardiales bacterium]|nr:hypothetical protein [Pseudonocardiales bacterium]